MKRIKNKLAQNQRVYSTLVTVTNPKWMDIYRSLNLDFVFIDTEHIPLNLSDVSQLCHQFSSLEIPAVVRIPDHDPYKACMALDAGAGGILVPYIETAEQVRAIIGAVKYKPLKGHKLEQFLSGEISLEKKLLDYLNAQNKDNLLFINIESVPAIENLEELLAFQELDGIIIGPHDLSCSLGIPEEYENPLFLATIDRIIACAVKHGKSVGYHKGYAAGNPDQMIKWAGQGMNILIYEGDIIAASASLNQNLEYMRLKLGDSIEIEQDSLVI